MDVADAYQNGAGGDETEIVNPAQTPVARRGVARYPVAGSRPR
jgi:hypothetical protein